MPTVILQEPVATTGHDGRPLYRPGIVAVTGSASRSPDAGDWLTTEGAALRLGASPHVVAALFKNGMLPAYVTATNATRRWCRAADVDRLRRRLVTRPDARGRPETVTEYYLAGPERPR